MDITKMPGKDQVNRIFVVMGSNFISNLIGKRGNRSMQLNSLSGIDLGLGINTKAWHTEKKKYGRSK